MGRTQRGVLNKLECDNYKEFKKITIDRFLCDDDNKRINWEKLGLLSKSEVYHSSQIENKLHELFNEIGEREILRKDNPLTGDYLIDGKGLRSYTLTREPYYGDWCEDQVSIYYPKTKDDAIGLATYFGSYFTYNNRHKISQYVETVKSER